VVAGACVVGVVESVGTEPVEPVGMVLGVVTAVGVGVLEAESPGLITKITSAVSNTTALAPPTAFTSSWRGRPGFHSARVGRWAGFRRFVTS
jgi:hypothetical protein